MTDSDWVVLGLCVGLIGFVALYVVVWIVFFD
jgi:hypothetical protein